MGQRNPDFDGDRTKQERTEFDKTRLQQAKDGRTGRSAAEMRIANQGSWVEQQIRVAMAKGEFDNLPGSGKPLDLGDSHDPEWWTKRLIEREKIAVLPPSLQLRKDDQELDATLDRLGSERDVRTLVEDFNQAVMKARYDPRPGPPLITQPRDLDAEVEAWRERRAARRAAMPPPPPPEPKPRWWRRLRRP